MNGHAKLIEPWNTNARLRHEQVLGGKDVSFSKILIPAFVDLLRSLGPINADHLLDVGCGSGIFTKAISRFAKKITGIDPSCESIRIARDYNKKHTNVLFECTSIEEYSKTCKERFDIAVANMTLHTIEFLDDALRSVAECITPKGLFVFSIPHPCFYLLQKSDFDKSDYRYIIPSYHEILFTISNVPEPLPSPTPYFHRPIESYSTSLYSAGFLTKRLVEPFPNKETMAEYPAEKKWEYPHFLLFVCSRA